MQMIFPTHQSTFAEGPEGEPFIVPLAIPLIAGPSTLTTVLLFSLQDPGRIGMWAGVIGVSWLINAVILAGLSGWLSKILGQRGLLAMEKLMGMILVTISVQMIMTGLKKFLAS
jgi:multiple antibiotic resistance protein